LLLELGAQSRFIFLGLLCLHLCLLSLRLGGLPGGVGSHMFWDRD